MARKGIAGRDFQFFDSLALNNVTYNEYTIRLLNIALARFKWENVPKGIDIRYLELMLITQGSALVFYEDSLDQLVWGLHTRARSTGTEYRLNEAQLPQTALPLECWMSLTVCLFLIT